MMYPIVYVNDRFVEADKAGLPVSDLGLLRGHAVFEFFKVLESVPLFVEEHLDRFFRSASGIGISPTWTPEELMEIWYAVIRNNQLTEAGIRTVITGGASPDGHTPTVPNLYCVAHKLPEYPEQFYSDGGRILHRSYRRDIPHIKTTNYAFASSLQETMRQTNTCEVLYSWEGRISECSRSNIFFIDKHGSCITPREGILEGITRGQAIGIIRNEGRVSERDITIEEIAGFREAFITSTTKSVMPVVQIGDRVIGNGRPGPFTRKLIARFSLHRDNYINQKKKAGQGTGFSLKKGPN